jgi:hypothetical protein
VKEVIDGTIRERNKQPDKMKLVWTTVLISSIIKGDDSLFTTKYVIIYKCPSLEEL